MDDKRRIMVHLVEKMMNRRLWGGKHTELRNLKKNIPKDLIGGKVARDAVEELIRREFILTKTSTHEMHVSLNPRKQKEIIDIIQKEC